MAKGIFTQIKYNAQGVILRDATVTGMIVGIPITTEQKALIQINEEDVTLASVSNSYVSEIKFDLEHPQVNHEIGDVIQEMRVWIKKSNEDNTRLHEIKGDDLDVTDGVYAMIPVKRLAASNATWEQNKGVLTFNTKVVGLEAGYTVKIGSNYGIVSGSIGTDALGNTECRMRWITNVTANIPSSSVEVYYDYVYNPYSKTPRGYTLYFDKVAYRPRLYGVHTISSMDDIVDMFGENALSNPKSNLAMGAFLYGSAAGWGDKFKICALDLRVKATAGALAETSPDDLMDDMVSWSSAFSNYADPHKDVYYIAAMTANDTVHDSIITYVNQASKMENQSEKFLYLAKKIVGVVDDVDQDVLDDNFGNGRYGELDYKPGETYRDGYIEGDAVKYFDKNSDVETAMSVPMPFNNERVVFVGCEYGTVDNVNVEGYYITAIIAGWRSSLAMGYDTSDMKVPLLTSIAGGLSFYGSKDYSDLAQSGWYMLTQETFGAPVTCYIQRTTGYDSVERSEESFIVALDYCMRDIRSTLAPYTRGGLENRISADNPKSPRTVSYLAKLNAAIALVRDKYITNLDVFSAMEVIGVRASKMKKTGAEVDVKFNHYYPVREIIVTAYVE